MEKPVAVRIKHLDLTVNVLTCAHTRQPRTGKLKDSGVALAFTSHASAY
jgi:hypothetical protein